MLANDQVGKTKGWQKQQQKQQQHQDCSDKHDTKWTHFTTEQFVTFDLLCITVFTHCI